MTEEHPEHAKQIQIRCTFCGKKYRVSSQEESKLLIKLPKSFNNPHEYDAEYILIPGGRYKYSQTGQIESVPDMYFAKYPVTNKRYRRFIRYLDKQEPELQNILPVSQFQGLLAEFASSVQGFADYLGAEFASSVQDVADYLGSDKAEWTEKLRPWYYKPGRFGRDEQPLKFLLHPSFAEFEAQKAQEREDADRCFGGDDQPVVDVSCFAAKAYCLWLTELTRTGANSSASQATGVFRLPKDVEWEWAAGAGDYYWAPEKVFAGLKLANRCQVVGTTTPVGSYPDGATPEGLMDMAGNVWEWMDDLYGPGGWMCTYRGGSWFSALDSPRQPVGHYLHPSKRYNDHGFRVVRSQS